ncbi:unnamed protein product, partial [Notodromas monacha]
MSAVEIVGQDEHLRDLLAPFASDAEGSPGIFLCDDPVLGMQLVNQSEIRASTVAQAGFLLDAALASRTQTSPSPHLLVTLDLYQYAVTPNGTRAAVSGGRSRLHLLDLSGGADRLGKMGGSSLNNWEECGVARVGADGSSASSDPDPSSSEQSCDTVIYLGPAMDDATDGEHPPSVAIPNLSDPSYKCALDRLGNNVGPRFLSRACSEVRSQCTVEKAAAAAAASRRFGLGSRAMTCVSLPASPLRGPRHHQQQQQQQLQQQHHQQQQSPTLQYLMRVSRSPAAAAVHRLPAVPPPASASAAVHPPPRHYFRAPLPPPLTTTQHLRNNHQPTTISSSREQWIDGPRSTHQVIPVPAGNKLNTTKAQDSRQQQQRHLSSSSFSSARPANAVAPPAQLQVTPARGSSQHQVAQTPRLFSYGYMDAHKISMIERWVEVQTAHLDDGRGGGGGMDSNHNLGDQHQHQQLIVTEMSSRAGPALISPSDGTGGRGGVDDDDEIRLDIAPLATNARGFVSISQETSHEPCFKDSRILDNNRNENEAIPSTKPSVLLPLLGPQNTSLVVDKSCHLPSPVALESGDDGTDNVEAVAVTPRETSVFMTDSTAQVTEEDIAMCMGLLTENALPELDGESGTGSDHPLRILSQENITIVSTLASDRWSLSSGDDHGQDDNDDLLSWTVQELSNSWGKEYFSRRFSSDRGIISDERRVQRPPEASSDEKPDSDCQQVTSRFCPVFGDLRKPDGASNPNLSHVPTEMMHHHPHHHHQQLQQDNNSDALTRIYEELSPSSSPHEEDTSDTCLQPASSSAEDEEGDPVQVDQPDDDRESELVPSNVDATICPEQFWQFKEVTSRFCPVFGDLRKPDGASNPNLSHVPTEMIHHHPHHHHQQLQQDNNSDALTRIYEELSPSSSPHEEDTSDTCLQPASSSAEDEEGDPVQVDQPDDDRESELVPSNAVLGNNLGLRGSGKLLGRVSKLLARSEHRLPSLASTTEVSSSARSPFSAGKNSPSLHGESSGYESFLRDSECSGSSFSRGSDPEEVTSSPVRLRYDQQQQQQRHLPETNNNNNHCNARANSTKLPKTHVGCFRSSRKFEGSKCKAQKGCNTSGMSEEIRER